MRAGRETGLQWIAANTGNTKDGRWSCRGSSQGFIAHTSMHPCVSEDGTCCDAASSSMGVRYISNTWDQAAQAVITFEVWPSCGDGFTLRWVVHQGFDQETIYTKTFLPSADPPYRESIEKTVPLSPGDSMVFSVHPGLNHDCDGVYIHDIQVWQSATVST